MWQIVALGDAARLIGAWWDKVPSDPRAYLTPDSLASHARTAGCEVTVEAVASWEELSDRDLCTLVLERAGPFQGDLLLITEASFDADVGAFRFPADELDKAIEEHQDRYEPVFNGDVIFAVLLERRLVCIHHENYLIMISGPRGSPTQR